MEKKKNEQSHNYAKVRYLAADWKKLKAQVDKSTCRSVAEYIRKITLEKPVTMYFRDQSLDELFNECIVLRNEMRAIRQLLPASHSAIPKLLDIHQKIFQLIEKIADHVTKNQQL